MRHSAHKDIFLCIIVFSFWNLPGSFGKVSPLISAMSHSTRPKGFTGHRTISLRSASRKLSQKSVYKVFPDLCLSESFQPGFFCCQVERNLASQRGQIFGSHLIWGQRRCFLELVSFFVGFCQARSMAASRFVLGSYPSPKTHARHASRVSTARCRSHVSRTGCSSSSLPSDR